MKDFKKPQSKEKTIALGFTLGVHVVAMTGLLFLGMSKPVEPPKQIKMVLVTPEDLLPPEPMPLEQTDFAETAHEKVAEQIQQTAKPSVEDAPVIPVTQPTPPTPPAKPDVNKAAQETKAAAEALKKAEQKATEQAKAAEANKLKAQADAGNKAKADAANKAQADAAAKAKADAANKAQADAAAKAKADAANKAKADAANKAKSDAA